MDCRILRNEKDVEAIADEWRALYTRLAPSPFVDYDAFMIWWGTIGRTEKRRRLHVVIGRESGKLVGVLPLTVMRNSGLRIMQAAGFRSYNYTDALAETPEQLAALWQAARKSPYYDFADIRDVYPESACYAALSGFAERRDMTEAFYLRFNWSKGSEWLEHLPISPRNNFKRCMRRLNEKAPVTFHVHEGDTIPEAIVEKMVKQKVAWSIENNKRGVFGHAAVLDLYRQLLGHAARQGNLFLSWLTCGDDIIAYHQGFIHKGVMLGFFWAYDPTFSRYSPGALVMVNSILYAIDRGMTGLDFRQGESQVKRLHSNERRQCAEFTFSGSARGRLIEKAYMFARDMARRAKSKLKGK